MKKYIIFVGLAFLSVSCIDWGLDELPLNRESKILNFMFEYRYSVTNVNGFERLEYKVLSNGISISENQIVNVLTIPPPSGTFTAEIASQVSLGNIVGYANISPAAVIEPVEGAPALGKIGDFSQPAKYRVTAADGATTVWTVMTIISE